MSKIKRVKASALSNFGVGFLDVKPLEDFDHVIERVEQGMGTQLKIIISFDLKDSRAETCLSSLCKGFGYYSSEGQEFSITQLRLKPTVRRNVYEIQDLTQQCDFEIKDLTLSTRSKKGGANAKDYDLLEQVKVITKPHQCVFLEKERQVVLHPSMQPHKVNCYASTRYSSITLTSKSRCQSLALYLTGTFELKGEIVESLHLQGKVVPWGIAKEFDGRKFDPGSCMSTNKRPLFLDKITVVE